MISCMVLEWPGRWRARSAAFLLALPIVPTLPLVWFALFSGDGFSVGGVSFQRALTNSAIVAFLVTLSAFALGLPVGVLNALYDYKCRRLLLPLSLLPLLAPSFIWPLGWRWLFEHRGKSLLPLISGYSGSVLMFLPAAVTLVLFTTFASMALLSVSQVEAARLAGGERTVFRLACRYAAAPAALAAMLAGIFTLSDPGAGFAVGLSLASSEILISFQAFYDYAQAGRQCLLLALDQFACFAAHRLFCRSAPGCRTVCETVSKDARRPPPGDGERGRRGAFSPGVPADSAPGHGIDLSATSLGSCHASVPRSASHRNEHSSVRSRSRHIRGKLRPGSGILHRTRRTLAPACDWRLPHALRVATHAPIARDRARRCPHAGLDGPGAPKPPRPLFSSGDTFLSCCGATGAPFLGHDVAIAGASCRRSWCAAGPLFLALGAASSAHRHRDGSAAGWFAGHGRNRHGLASLSSRRRIVTVAYFPNHRLPGAVIQAGSAVRGRSGVGRRHARPNLEFGGE